jgi:hypothetical protein
VDTEVARAISHQVGQFKADVIPNRFSGEESVLLRGSNNHPFTDRTFCAVFLLTPDA